MMGLLSILITLIILGLLFYCVVWLIGWVGVPEPFNKIIKAIVGIILIVYLFGLLLGAMPVPTHFWKP